MKWKVLLSPRNDLNASEIICSTNADYMSTHAEKNNKNSLMQKSNLIMLFDFLVSWTLPSNPILTQPLHFSPASSSTLHFKPQTQLKTDFEIISSDRGEKKNKYKFRTIKKIALIVLETSLPPPLLFPSAHFKRQQAYYYYAHATKLSPLFCNHHDSWENDVKAYRSSNAMSPKKLRHGCQFWFSFQRLPLSHA